MPDTTLSTAIESLRQAFDDLTSVEVLTYTGSLQDVVKADPADGTRKRIDWNAMRNFQLEGTLKLAAATRIDVDYDVINFRSETDLSDDLRTLHDEALKTSLEARRQFLEMFVSMLKG